VARSCAVVPWAHAGAGAVATQALANYNYGSRGLELLRESKTAAQTVEALVSSRRPRATYTSYEA